MDAFWIGTGSALWLGILTAISPCPLAANIAAIAFLSKKTTQPKLVFWTGASYIAGRMVSYAVLGFIITSSLLGVPILANFLQKYMNRALGPILFVTGLFLLNVFRLNLPGLSVSEENQKKLAGGGMGGAFVLGLIFALAFCPVSAALFFGSLIPLSLKSPQGAMLPLIYGIGTGLPALLFAWMIALGLQSLGLWFHRLTKLEYWMKKVTGITFLIIGIYYFAIYWLKTY